MGNDNQGVIWNDSDFMIEYSIYGKFDQIKISTKKIRIDPKISLNAEEIALQGFYKQQEEQIQSSYSQSFVQVPPGEFSTSGLTKLQMNEHKISIRVRIGQFVKYILKDIVVKDRSDICLKVRSNLSIKNMTSDEVNDIVAQNKIRTVPVSIQEMKERQKKRRQAQKKTFQILQAAYQIQALNQNSDSDD